MIRENMAQDTMTHHEVCSFHVTIPEEALVSVDASRRRAGPTRRPSPISRRVSSRPSCRSWFSIGATAGVRQKRSSTPYRHEVDKGGHFAAWEQPQLFSQEIRVAFRSLR